ncbi:hypothetical protein KL911_000955 [Ogataea haglerorum]|uniref:uncharacterized protein n=1 Tax=Ogataea haglerorum TaxID=1937702 RepID=UPI001C89B7BF|nr:uncharacterized protein KL911_000955 [Ogataea haglerorum]KAG7706589.1 hypothetical protein KL950_003254 [Ogataea haglerorum]KAG7709328.1 hypothetical protein KL914_001718 [Ogataea haglerorum]KAG7757979.1 hypothetical protein KL911_000955 [Ogataea haglerorum]KAG7789396.1 hypothetical protein KL945_001944 [Ogataea haglerorum]
MLRLADIGWAPYGEGRCAGPLTLAADEVWARGSGSNLAMLAFSSDIILGVCVIQHVYSSSYMFGDIEECKGKLRQLQIR